MPLYVEPQFPRPARSCEERDLSLQPGSCRCKRGQGLYLRSGRPLKTRPTELEHLMWHQGKAWFFGDDVDTDQIMPARYLALKTAEDLSKHALEAVDPSWPTTIKPGDVLFAGANFGCGSSREHAALGLKGLGVGCVVAKS